MSGFAGRTALVTGGALGIGRGICRAFSREGAAVAVADIDRTAAEALAEELSRAGGRAVAAVGDVSKAADAERLVNRTIEELGRLDILVNNAGIAPIDWYFRLEDTPEEVWDRIIGVNLKGTFLMSKYALPHIRQAGGGVVVNMASVQGLQSMPKVPSYAASKGGVLSLTRNMALDYAADGIRVVAICPGTIDSELVRTLARAEPGDEEANLARYGAVHPIGRLGEPEDVAEAVLFLASEQASFITGEYLCVDGGLMARGAWASSAGADV
ncbi:MAG: SDR family oxidoreductase [Chloroflexi bacterium]|nr:SDR family oxidoreductase [Chloroflexota bacterium]